MDFSRRDFFSQLLGKDAMKSILDILPPEVNEFLGLIERTPEAAGLTLGQKTSGAMQKHLEKVAAARAVTEAAAKTAPEKDRETLQETPKVSEGLPSV